MSISTPVVKDRDNSEFLKSLQGNPILQGSLITVKLIAGMPKMAYPLPVRGWFIAGTTTQSTVWGSTSIKGLLLNCSADTTVTLWVF